MSFDDDAIKEYVGKLVLSTGQATVNAPLGEEGGQLVNAGRNERTDERKTYGSCHHKRKLVVVLDHWDNRSVSTGQPHFKESCRHMGLIDFCELYVTKPLFLTSPSNHR